MVVVGVPVRTPVPRSTGEGDPKVSGVMKVMGVSTVNGELIFTVTGQTERVDLLS